jgi:hypothetical protein
VRERFGARGTLLWLAGVAEALWSERRGSAARETEEESSDAAVEFRRLASLGRD